jgi:hypothetical protein
MPILNAPPATPCRGYWVLFFELFVLLAAAITSCLPPARLDAGRHVLAHFFSIATVLIMTALNVDLNLYVWKYFDVAPLFSDFDGVPRTLYMSGSALCAGWVLMVILNAAWIAAILPQAIAPAAPAGAGGKRGPIVGAVTGAESVQVQVAHA